MGTVKRRKAVEGNAMNKAAKLMDAFEIAANLAVVGVIAVLIIVKVA